MITSITSMPAESGVAEVGPCKATLVKATAFSIAYIQYLFPSYHPIIITGASEAQGLPLKPVWDTHAMCTSSIVKLSDIVFLS